MSALSGVEKVIIWCDRALSPIENWANFAAAIGIFLLMLLGVLQIVLRTIFDTPIAGYIDFVELATALMAFMGAAYTQRLGAHIRMDLIIGRLHGRSLWLLEALGSLVALIIVAVLIWYSSGHAIRSFTLGDTTMDAELVVWPSKALVPIAFSLWFLRLLVQFIGALRLVFEPSAVPQGVVLVKDVTEQAQEEIEEALGQETQK